jgi:hypothetical protein
MMEAKLKRLCLATQTWRYAKITQKLENLLELDTNAVQQKTRPRLDTGLAKCGKEIQCLTKVERIV